MVKVLVDPSFLVRMVDRPLGGLMMLEEKLGKIEFLVPHSVIDELKSLTKLRSIRARYAEAALRFASDLELTFSVKGDNVDSAILNYAMLRDIPVATMDAELRRRLVRKGVTVVSAKDDRIIIDGNIHIT